MTLLTQTDAATTAPPYGAVVQFRNSRYVFLPADVGRCHSSGAPRLDCAFVESSEGCGVLTCTRGCYIEATTYAALKLVGDIE